MVSTMGNRLLRLSASMIFGSVVVSILAGLLHPDREPANSHPAVFAEYAASDLWTLVHLGQFVGMAGLIAGLVLLSFAFEERDETLSRGNGLTRMAAIVSLALYGVLQAVDGVALKQAVNAWAAAPEAEKLTRFASAESIRWLEWGARSYHGFLFGLTLILFATVIALKAPVPKFVGFIMGLSGLAYLYQGWIIGSEGFSMRNHMPTLFGYVLVILWSLSLLVVSWRTAKAPSRPM
jgi:hypothetical protein